MGLKVPKGKVETDLARLKWIEGISTQINFIPKKQNCNHKSK